MVGFARCQEDGHRWVWSEIRWCLECRECNLRQNEVACIWDDVPELRDMTLWARSEAMREVAHIDQINLRTSLIAQLRNLNRFEPISGGKQMRSSRGVTSSLCEEN